MFTRFPRAGEAKTRLIPALGKEGAAELQSKMSKHIALMMHHASVVLEQAPFVSHDYELELEARITGSSPKEAQDWLGITCRAQSEGNLGERLGHALSEGFDREFDVVAVLGGDCPELNGANIAEAIGASRKNRGAALIPARDGGYCLLVLEKSKAQSIPFLLEDISWGSSSVCEQQLERLKEYEVPTEILPTLSDVDEAEDLAVWERIEAAWYGPLRSITVIIPTLNEEALLEQCVTAVRNFFDASEDERSLEIIVSDGGSYDATLRIAEALSCRVVSGEAQRAAQLNRGSAAASGDLLLFLHADTLIKARNSESIANLLEHKPLTLGAFSFGFDTKDCGAREKLRTAFYAFNTRIRNRIARDPYGDQALFCRTALFNSLGTFGEVPFMEDVLFVERAQRANGVQIIKSRAFSSPRRYLRFGFLKTMIANRVALFELKRGKTLRQIAENYKRNLNRNGS